MKADSTHNLCKKKKNILGNHRSSNMIFAKHSNTLRHNGFSLTVLHEKFVTHSAHDVFGVNSHKVATKIPRTRQSNFERYQRNPRFVLGHFEQIVHGPQFRFDPQKLRFQHSLWLRHWPNKPIGGKFHIAKPIERYR